MRRLCRDSTRTWCGWFSVAFLRKRPILWRVPHCASSGNIWFGQKVKRVCPLLSPCGSKTSTASRASFVTELTWTFLLGWDSGSLFGNWHKSPLQIPGDGVLPFVFSSQRTHRKAPDNGPMQELDSPYGRNRSRQYFRPLGSHSVTTVDDSRLPCTKKEYKCGLSRQMVSVPESFRVSDDRHQGGGHQGTDVRNRLKTPARPIPLSQASSSSFRSVRSFPKDDGSRPEASGSACG